MRPDEYALIVAGGKGTRLKSNIPKQFIELNGLPVLLHTLNAFFQYAENIKIILVLPHDDFDTWHTLAKKYNFNRPVVLQEGGATRFQSVKKGLEKVEDENALVAIHDGVRPLVAAKTIAESFRLAALHQTAVAAVRLKDSIRTTPSADLDENGLLQGTKTADRSRFWLVQTPQTFDVKLIKNAYTIEEDNRLTDDASVVERAGHEVVLFEGSYRNIKITTEEDLMIAQALLQANRHM